jgi:hypothetical protein
LIRLGLIRYVIAEITRIPCGRPSNEELQQRTLALLAKWAAEDPDYIPRELWQPVDHRPIEVGYMKFVQYGYWGQSKEFKAALARYQETHPNYSYDFFHYGPTARPAGRKSGSDEATEPDMPAESEAVDDERSIEAPELSRDTDTDSNPLED